MFVSYCVAFGMQTMITLNPEEKVGKKQYLYKDLNIITVISNLSTESLPVFQREKQIVVAISTELGKCV